LRGALLVFSVATLFVSEAGRLLGPQGVEWAKALGVYLWTSVLVTMSTIAAFKFARAGVPDALRVPRDSRPQLLAARRVGSVNLEISNPEP
jgi:hypothetical protein